MNVRSFVPFYDLKVYLYSQRSNQKYLLLALRNEKVPFFNLIVLAEFLSCFLNLYMRRCLTICFET